MVTNSNVSSNMKLEDDKVSRKRSSSACLHCDFRSDSPGVLTQHLWENHPLRMRRKQHLFGTLIISENKTKGAKEKRLQNSDVDPEGSSDKDDRIQEKPTSDSATLTEPANKRIRNTHGYDISNDKVLHKCVNPATVHSTIYSQLDHAGSIFLPSQYVTIPFPNSSSMVNQIPSNVHAPHLEKLNAYQLASALTLQLRQNEMNLAFNVSQMAFKQHTSSANTSKSPPSSSSSSHLHQHILAPTSNVSAFSSGQSGIPTFSQSDFKTPLTSDGNVKYIGWQQQYQTNPPIGREQTRPRFDPKTECDKRSSKKTSSRVDSSSNSLIDNKRMLALEEALQAVCFYDVNDTSSVMPFKCPDNVWRMVRFKCIKGVWLVQLPDSDSPTLYVPFQKSASSIQHQSCLRDALRNKPYNPLFNLFNSSDGKRIECPMIHPGASSNTKRPVEMFTNVEKSEVKAKRVQRTIKSGNLLRSLLSGSYDGIRSRNSAYGNHNLPTHLNSMTTYKQPVTNIAS